MSFYYELRAILDNCSQKTRIPVIMVTCLPEAEVNMDMVILRLALRAGRRIPEPLTIPPVSSSMRNGSVITIPSRRMMKISLTRRQSKMLQMVVNREMASR